MAETAQNQRTAGNLPDIVKSIRAGGLSLTLKHWRANGDKPASHFIEISQKDRGGEWVNIGANVSDVSGIAEALNRLKQIAILREDGE